MFPASMLERLYVKGSLKNTSSGFELSLTNTIDYAMLVGIGPVTVDGAAFEAAAIRLKIGDQEWRGDQITYARPFPARMFIPIQIFVEGPPLAPGEHLINITATTQEIGMIRFDIRDSLSA